LNWWIAFVREGTIFWRRIGVKINDFERKHQDVARENHLLKREDPNLRTR
jgi:hypothetical protein